MEQLPQKNLRTWIEVDTKAIAKNYRTFRKLIGKKTMLMSVVKSNAYGHNIHEFAIVMESLGADWLGVDSLTEALALRKDGVQIPILVLGFTIPARYKEAAKAGISLTISSIDQFTELQKISPSKNPLRVHIKADTGMHRQGFQLEEAQDLLSRIALSQTKIFHIEGLYTHFAEAKNPRSGDSTRRQIAEFEKWKALFFDAGHDPICHASATGGAMLYPQARYDMVRIGIGSYGLWPSGEAETALSPRTMLSPVLSWKSIVSEVKRVKKGERVGYDFTARILRDSVLAVVPVGYWHGVPRMLSGKGRVLIGGKSAGFVGRVSMDMIVVDVTDIPRVKMGDEVVLIGTKKEERIPASEIAQFAGTTHYEIVTRLNPLIKRIYI
jgi:alanine racemase